jgi:hypothetical protein
MQSPELAARQERLALAILPRGGGQLPKAIRRFP